MFGDAGLREGSYLPLYCYGINGNDVECYLLAYAGGYRTDYKLMLPVTPVSFIYPEAIIAAFPVDAAADGSFHAYFGPSGRNIAVGYEYPDSTGPVVDLICSAADICAGNSKSIAVPHDASYDNLFVLIFSRISFNIRNASAFGAAGRE